MVDLRMPISVTCDCGSRLEIDEKFLGKEIPCPDCGKPLPTKAPAAPPPLELHDNRRTSGLAVLALTIGIVGFFTVIGSLVAIGLGLLSMRMLGKSKRLEGISLARAAIAVGGAGILATIVILITPLGLDFFFRDFAYLTRAPVYETGTNKIEVADASVKRPEKSGPWARLAKPTQVGTPVSPDKLIAAYVRGDAFISCVRATRELQEPDDPKDKEKDWRDRVLERVRKSELVAMLSSINGPPNGEGTVTDAKKSDEGVHEFILNMRFGRVDRTFLVLYRVQHRQKIDVFIGCCRPGNFGQMEEEFRESFKGFTAD
jgi:hypothetical protein